METKQIPFDLETVKKIQAGEIKGSILTRDGRPARFLGEIKDPVYPLVFAREIKHSKAKELLDVYTLTGSYSAALDEHDNDIIIEIEDEQQKPEYQFKVGDKVRLKPNNTHSNFVRKYNNCIGKIIEISNEIFIVVLDGVFQDLFKADELELVKKPKTYEFKPFDRVLVMDKENGNHIWQAAFYSHFVIGVSNGYYATTAGDFYLDGEIIPYEGNEHLLGTTNKPKED